MRINITVDPETMRLADRLARKRKVSRSAILRDGVRSLAESEERQLEEAARRTRQRKAAEELDRIAQKLGDWPAEKLLRSWRYRLAGRDSETKARGKH